MWEAGTQSLPAIVSMFDAVPQSPVDVLQVTKEDQFNNWLFKRMKHLLVPNGFNIEPEEINKDIATCCEYSSSKPDCVVYHAQSLFVHNNVSALTITIDSDSDSDAVNSDDTDVVNINDLETMKLGETNGCAFEIKSKRVNDAAINECIYNMFSAGSRLAIWSLQKGNIVQKVNMYGIVVAMEDPLESYLLKLEMDFDVNMCYYYLVRRTFSFNHAVNMVLSKLCE